MVCYPGVANAQGTIKITINKSATRHRATVWPCKYSTATVIHLNVRTAIQSMQTLFFKEYYTAIIFCIRTVHTNDSWESDSLN